MDGKEVYLHDKWSCGVEEGPLRHTACGILCHLSQELNSKVLYVSGEWLSIKKVVGDHFGSSYYTTTQSPRQKDGLLFDCPRPLSHTS